jgi:hypothetical protein
MKTADEILAEHEDANEMHFHQVDREWVIKAMEEYARQASQNHFCDYIITSYQGHRVLKCLYCQSIASPA